MDRLGEMNERAAAPGEIAIVGGGPAGLVTAIALARRGIRTTVFERDSHPEEAQRFNPDRSYSIDITGHGLRALKYIDATSYFDARMLGFKGIQHRGRVVQEWSKPGWTGSRGDILRALMDVITEIFPRDVGFEFQCRVSSVDVHTGALTYRTSDREAATRQFDLIIGADGAGSVVRQSMQDQVKGFSVEAKSIPNYVTMIELDRVGDQLDKNYLQALSIRHFIVAGAINGEQGRENPRWFCAVGADHEQVFSSTDEAQHFFQDNCSQILQLASDEAVAAFAQRRCYHIGQMLSCSQLHGGRAVLIGDAGAPFPPIGQGVNAAMESAIVLDRCVGEAGTKLLEAAALYNTTWKPEADAVSWISEQTLFEKPLNTLRSLVTMAIGQNVVDQAKSAEMSYSEVRQKAKRLGILWS